MLRCNKDLKVGYSGIEGSFAYIAAGRIFPGATYISYRNFRECYEAAEKGECDAAVLPIENSFAGEVAEVTDLMYHGSLHVNGMYELPVAHCLLGIPGSEEDSIEAVTSHPQALAQCAGYLSAHHIRTNGCENTARAARAVAEAADSKLGAVASAETAELYGLKILKKDIQDSSNNTTKFCILERESAAEQGLVESELSILMFNCVNVSGSLLKALSVISEYGYNMRVIRSRPVKNVNWQYYFYTEIEGDLRSEKGKRMIEELGKACVFLKIAGTFHAGNTQYV